MYENYSSFMLCNLLKITLFVKNRLTELRKLVEIKTKKQFQQQSKDAHLQTDCFYRHKIV